MVDYLRKSLIAWTPSYLQGSPKCANEDCGQCFVYGGPFESNLAQENEYVVEIKLFSIYY